MLREKSEDPKDNFNKEKTLNRAKIYKKGIPISGKFYLTL